MRFHAAFTEPRWAPIILSADGVAFHFDLSLLSEVSRFFHRLQMLPSRRTAFASDPNAIALHVAKYEALAIILTLVRDDHVFRTGLRHVPPVPVTHENPEIRVNLYDICFAYEFSPRVTWFLPHPAWAGAIEGPAPDQTEHDALVDRQTTSAVQVAATYNYT